MAGAMTKQEKQWQLESDARTIREYANLTADNIRFNAASDFIKAEKERLTAVLTAQTYVPLYKNNKE